MRTSILFLIILTLAGASAFGEEGFFDNLDFQLSSTPTELGNITKGYLAYRISNDQSIRVKLKTELSSKLESNETSLLATKNSNLFVDLYLLEFSLNPLGLPFRIGLGGNITKLNVEEKGHETNQAVTSTLLLSNVYEVIFYSPKISASVSFDLPFGEFDYVFSYSPVYFYNLSQTVSVRPYIGSASTFTFQGSGAPYIENNSVVTIMDLIQINTIHEYQRISYSMLGIDTGTASFVSTPSEFEINSVTIIGNLVLDITGLGEVTIGGGRTFSQTRDLKNTDATVAESQYNMFNVGFKTSL